MPKFEIDDHHISTRQWDAGGVEVESHTVELIGSASRAILMFDSGLDTERLGSVVGYVTDEGEGAVSIVGWFPVEEFHAYRDILSGGNRMSVDFELRDGGAGAGYLRRLAIKSAESVLAARNNCRAANDTKQPAAFAMPL